MAQNGGAGHPGAHSGAVARGKEARDAAGAVGVNVDASAPEKRPGPDGGDLADHNLKRFFGQVDFFLFKKYGHGGPIYAEGPFEPFNIGFRQVGTIAVNRPSPG
jgi:hypothetical protein